jgi:hypothetical protein
MAHSFIWKVECSSFIGLQVQATFTSLDSFAAIVVVCIVGDSSQLLVRFYLSGAYVTCSLTVLVVTSYTTARGAPRVLRTQVRCPSCRVS